MYTNHLIINYISTLAHHIACMGVNNSQMTDLPQVGRLCHQLVNSHTGPLDSEYGMGIPDKLCVGAIPKSFQTSLLFHGTNQSDR